MTSVHPDQDKQEFRQNMGIPFARPGNAIDYAQTVIGIMVVSTRTAGRALCGRADATLSAEQVPDGFGSRR